MSHRRNEKHCEVSYTTAEPVLEQRIIEMPDEPIVHGKVPGLPILHEILAVPPILVEASISKPEQLPENV